ncbi:MAG: hypothetical protein JWO72_3024 [Caulobacteraceae bacterium]|nr:hypothetical protein [Caulobacteraceae bacterium]
MKLNYAPQAGLRRRRPDHVRERLAFWGGIAIVAAFELVLMAKTWPPLHLPSDWLPGAAADSSALPSDSD